MSKRSWQDAAVLTVGTALGLILVLLAAACSGSDPSAADGAAIPDAGGPDQGGGPDMTPPLSWKACDTTSWPTGYPTPAAGVECTTIQVPIDHDKPAGKTIGLRVARHKSSSFPTGRAVFNLAGGPGGSAVGQSGTIPYYMPSLRQRFDLIYVDQRGTGGSDYLDCSAGYPYNKAGWVACASEHAGKDLGHYLTLDAARDLELVRRRLGYQKIHLRGGSYGTRSGLEYVRQYPASIAAAVLDGLAPPDWDYFAQATKSADWAVAKLVADCSASTACQAIAPSLGADLTARLQTLKTTPHKILVNGQPYDEDDVTFKEFLAAVLDYSGTRYKVPRAIQQAKAGDHTLWNQIVSSVYQVTIKDVTASDKVPAVLERLRTRRRPHLGQSYVAPGLFMTVVCAEWLPNSQGVAALKTLATQQTWGDAHMAEMAEACSAWKVSAIPAALRAPVKSPVKTLLLSGEIDLRTPPELGTHAQKTLTQGTHVVVPYASHSTISVSCASKILTQFLEADGEMSKVDTSCLKALQAPSW